MGLKRLRAVVCAAVLATVAVLAPGTADAKYASLVIDADTGRVLHSVNADTRNYPASLTKMMTLYMVFEALTTGRLTPSTKLSVSRRAANQPPSRLGLSVGSRITVNDAILALVTKSANDVAVVVAEALNGTERRFALAMTARARELGMSKTTFRNASGLPNRGQLSTARDMATLARALMRDFPGYYHYFSTQKFRHAGKTYKNHNALLKSYAGTDGIKTGYIRASGFNLVASTQRYGMRLIGVVFGGKTSRSRDAHMKTLLDKGFKKARASTVMAAAPEKPAVMSTETDRRMVVSEKTTWGIQVGAFVKPGDARAIAEKSKGLLPAILGDGVVRVVPLNRKSRADLFRARIHGIERRNAYRACKLLENRGIQCLEVRVTEPVQVAQSNQ
jgi:D-alanyl-D-alanine carboxypeptidase